MSSAISPETTITRSNNMIGSEVDNEVVLLDIDEGFYFGMNEIGSSIWKSIETPKPVKEIVAAIMDEFEVTRDECEADVAEFLGKLQEMKLIELS